MTAQGTATGSRLGSRVGSRVGGEIGGIGFIGGTVRSRPDTRSRASRAAHSAQDGPSSQRPGEWLGQ